MKKKYLKLFQIALHHAFYADGRAKDLVLDPSEATRHFMQQHDLRWGIDGGTYTMVYGHEVGSVAKLSYARLPVLLRFVLRSASPYFLNITDLPFWNQGAALLYVDNITPPDQPGSMLMNSDSGNGPLPKVTRDFLLPIYDAVFRVKNDATLPAALKPALAVPSMSDMPVWTPLEANDPNQGFQIDLRSLAPGKYGYEDAKGQVKSFYYAGQSLRPGDLGVLDFYLGKSVETMIPLPDASVDDDLSFNPDLPKRQYAVAFETRSTRWRYNVINKNTPPFERLEIDDGKAFSEGDPRQVASEEARTIVSNTALKLQERQPLKPKLKLIKAKGSSGHNGAPSSLDLPTPDWRNITAENGGEVYSDMYIFL